MLPADYRLQPSRAGRWSVCSGSVYLESFAPNEANQASLEGDAIHAVGAHWLDSRTGPDRAFLGAAAPGGIVYTGEMLDVAAEYVEAVRAANLPVFVEAKLDCRTIHPNCRGTPDAFYYHIDTRTVYIWDLKTGWGIVETEGNAQLLVYLVGIVDWIARERLPRPNRFAATIVQPRPWHPDGPVRTWLFGYPELEALMLPLQTAAYAAFQPEPPLCTGPQCANCDGITWCPAARENVGRTQDTTGRAMPDRLPPDALATEILALRSALGVLKPRLEALEAQATSLLKHGGQVPGFRLAPGRGKRVWTISETTLAMLGQAAGIDVYEHKLISPAKAEAAGLPKDQVKELCQTVKGAPTLALGDAAEEARKVFK